MQGLKGQNGKSTLPELVRSSSFDRTCEESVAESVTNELMLQMQSSLPPSKMDLVGSVEQQDESSKTKSKTAKSGRSSQEEKKLVKPNDEKRSRPRIMREFHNIKISQVRWLYKY